MNGSGATSDQEIWITVLGPLQVVCGGEVKALPAAERAVLGLLALADGSPVSRDSLVDALWGERPPASAVNIVYSYISRLRLLLGGSAKRGREIVPACAGSAYKLRLAADQLDLPAFRAAVVGARSALESHDLAAACREFERALASWRGDPLEDVEILRGHPAVIALSEERIQAVLDHADAAVSAGQCDRVVPLLRALVARNPLHEAMHARFLIALAATGCQAEALMLYEELRQRLDDELGALPGRELRDAHARVVRQELPVAGRGLPWTAAWLPVSQLPAAPADFTGRVAERERLAGAVIAEPGQPGPSVAVVSGPPGIGKTTLALLAGHAVSAEFPDGQLWVQLAGASARPRDPGDVLGELLRALGVPAPAIPGDDSERAVCYRTRLAGRRVLVVADDAASAAQVRPLIPGMAGCAVVVTSRGRLEGLEGARRIQLDVLSLGDAADLIIKMAGERRVTAEPEAAAELVRMCGALPLALRIAGAKLAARPSWPVSAMVRRLTGEHDRLGELEAEDLSVRASIASSYDTLPERHRRAFRLLSLLGPADFPEWVVSVLLGERGSIDVAEELTSRSLLTPLGVDQSGEPRYRLHDLLREYAAQRLTEDPDVSRYEALGRLFQGWLQLAQRADSRLPPEPYFPPPAQLPPPAVITSSEAERLTSDPIAWFTIERLNLLTAVEHACEAGQPDLARRLAAHLCAYQHYQSRHDDAERVWSAIAGNPGRSPEDAALDNYAQLRIGASLHERGRAAEAIPQFDRCVHDAERAGDDETLALGLYWRGCSAWDLEDFEQARAASDLGIAVAQRAGSRVALLMNMRLRSNALAFLGDADGAVEVSEQALVIASELKAVTYELAALHNLAFAFTRAGRHQRAIDPCARQIQLSKELGDVRREAQARAVLGDAYFGLGQPDKAVGSWLAAEALFRDCHAHRYYAVCLLRLGGAYEAMDRFQEAVTCLEESLLVFRRLRIAGKAAEALEALDRCRGAFRGTRRASDGA